MEKPIFQTTLLDKVKAANNNAQIDNLSERTISEIVDLFHPQFVEDDKITDDTWKIPVQMLLTMSGQLRHDTSEGINAFKTKFENENKETQAKAIADAIAAAKAQWEKDNKKPDVDPNKDANKDVDTKIADAIKVALSGLTGEDGAIGKLSKQFGDYLTLQAEKDKAATESQMRSQILDYVRSFDNLDADDVIVENTMLKLEINKDKDINALKNEAKSIYEGIYKKFVEKHGGGQPFSGSGAGKGGINPLIKSHLDRVTREAKDAADYSQSIEFAK